MAIEASVVEAVGRRIASLWPVLGERQRRLLLGAEARELGHGGVVAVARVAGVAQSTVVGGRWQACKFTDPGVDAPLG